jgi:hypothetical protein
MKLRSLLFLLITTLASTALGQGFDAWQSLWGPGRKSSGELYRSILEPPSDGPFRWSGKNWSLALGGQYFARIESRDNADFRSSLKDEDTFVEQRARVSVRAAFADRIGFLLEYQDVRVWGSERSTAFTEPLTGLHQGFVELKPTPCLRLRVGRQELSYGEDRLIGSLDWGMAARAFDGALLHFARGPVTVDAFGMVVRERSISPDTVTGAFVLNEGAQFYGLYGRWRPSPKGGLDLYALGYVNDPSTLHSGPHGDRGFATLGGRGFLHLAGLSVTAEAAYQVGSALDPGSNQAYDLRAWAVALKALYTLPVWGNPYVGFEYSRASGDGNPNDGEYNTFNQLFPTGHLHLGYMDYVAWQNVQAFHGFAGFRPWGAHLWIDVHRFQMVEPRGIWYNAAGQVFVQADPARTADAMGTEMDISLTVPLHKHFSIAGAYGVFFPGDAARPVSGLFFGRGTDTSHWGFLYLRSQF